MPLRPGNIGNSQNVICNAVLGTIFRPLINEGGKILGVGRNEPCPCGSGIKYKRCCLGKKPRTAKFTFDFDEPTRITSFSINRGKFEVFGSDGIVKPALTKMTVGYSREKGLKVLNEVTTQNNMIFRDREGIYRLRHVVCNRYEYKGNRGIKGINFMHYHGNC